MLGCGGGSSSTSKGNQTTPPTNLAYPQPTITAMVGVAISVDTPTVTGTVSSYAVSPALPAGVNLSTSSGIISGTPTATSAMANYTITASNSGGSTAATVKITVNPAVPPPSYLVYPQTALSLEAGQPFPSDIPTVSGTVTSYSVSPALPTGLNLDANTGTIYGVASAASASNTYIVTASNAGGNTTATLTLLVNPALVTLLDLGSANSITEILSVGSNVLVQDYSGHWALIDYSSGTELATGEQGAPWPIYMAGSTLAAGVANGIEVRSAANGSLQAIISSPMIDQTSDEGFTSGTSWRLASDGSYICFGSAAGLTAWSSSGSVLFSLSGNYGGAIFAAPGQIQVAPGPSGANVIQTVLTPSGSSSVGPAFSGNFNTWSLDGTFFLTNLSNTVWTYNAASSQTGFLTIPGFSPDEYPMGGEGGWIWAVEPSSAVTIYAVGSTTVAGSYPIGASDSVIPYGKTLGLLTYGTGQVTVVDLSGSSPVAAQYPTPTADNVAYATFSASQWLAGNEHGTVLDGVSLASTPRFLTHGTAFDIAGSSSIVAVAAADGTIYIFDPANTTPQQTIPFASSEVQLSTDGTVLAAAANANDYQYQASRTLNVYALPAGTLTNSWPYNVNGTDLFGFSLATSGSNIGQVSGTWNGSIWQYAREATAITGGATIWSDTPSAPVPPLLSPDGTLIAASNSTPGSGAATTIYQNGMAIAVVPGFAVGWIDDSDLLVDTYTGESPYPSYTGSAIYSPTGTLVASPPLPEIKNFQTVGPGLIYTPDSNTIYSTSTGKATWTSAYPYGEVYPPQGAGATADGDVVFLSGARVVVQSQ